MSGDNPLSTTAHFYKDPQYNAGKSNIAKQMFTSPPMPKEKELEQQKKLA